MQKGQVLIGLHYKRLHFEPLILISFLNVA